MAKKGVPRNKKVGHNIISAYRDGVAPIEGIEYVAVGREAERAFFKTDVLGSTEDGSGRFNVYEGPWGVGKSNLLSVFKKQATDKGFVVMTSEITKSRYFVGSNSYAQGLNLYKDLIKSTAIKTKTDGAFDTILNNFYDKLNEESDGHPEKIKSLFDMKSNSSEMNFCNLKHYYNFRGALFQRFNEISMGENYSEALKWFYAEYSTKSQLNVVKKEKRIMMDVNDVIKDSEWFDFLNTLSHFFVLAGYKGLIVLIDQVDQLINLGKTSRYNNYDFLVTACNEICKGSTEYFTLQLFASDKLFNSNKGIQMYPVLNDRLIGKKHMSPIGNEEIAVLLLILKEIYEDCNKIKIDISPEEIIKFTETMIDKYKLSDRGCIRPLTATWITRLDDELVKNTEKNSLIGDDERYKKLFEQQLKADEAREKEEAGSDFDAPDEP